MNTIHARRKPKRRPVTLIIGIICKDGIVVASDSQTTWETGKTWNANKMTELKGVYPQALVAESGSEVSSSRIVSHLVQIAEDRNVFKEVGMDGMAARAVKQVRDELRQQQFNCTSEEMQSFIQREGLDCRIMIAHYGDRPRIDTISLTLGIANKANHFFHCVGSGADLAAYLLTDWCAPDMDYGTALLIATCVVEIVKRHDPYCGGPVKLGVLRMPKPAVLRVDLPKGFPFELPNYDPPILLSKTEVEEFVSMAGELEHSIKKSRTESIKAALDQQRERLRKRLYEFSS